MEWAGIRPAAGPRVLRPPLVRVPHQATGREASGSSPPAAGRGIVPPAVRAGEAVDGPQETGGVPTVCRLRVCPVRRGDGAGGSPDAWRPRNHSSRRISGAGTGRRAGCDSHSGRGRECGRLFPGTCRVPARGPGSHRYRGPLRWDPRHVGRGPESDAGGDSPAATPESPERGTATGDAARGSRVNRGSGTERLGLRGEVRVRRRVAAGSGRRRIRPVTDGAKVWIATSIEAGICLVHDVRRSNKRFML